MQQKTGRKEGETMTVLRAVLIITIAMMLSGCWEYGDGEKIGTIIKLQKSGFFCKTWEATMVRGGFTDGSGVAGTTVSHFTVENKDMAETVKRLMETQTPVRVVFSEEVLTFCRSDSGSVFLTEIEPKH